jgi:hypothetical protein
MSCILLLIALVAFINEWGKKRPSLLRLSKVNFDWLRPVPAKYGYYRHLIIWLRIFLALFLVAWVFIEMLLPEYEPALLLISLSFPIFIAVHYFVLREKYYHIERGEAIILPPALAPLTVALLAIFIYVCTAGLGAGVIVTTLVVLVLFLGTILESWRRFGRTIANHGVKALLEKYTWAILHGVFLITLVPAIALFILFYKEEHNGITRMGMLSMMQKIDDRARTIDSKKNLYLRDDNPDFMRASKFRNGIYFTDRSADTPALFSEPVKTNFTAYSTLHNLLFQPDSTSLEALARLNAASDGSWQFATVGHPKRLVLDHCNPVGSCKNAFSLSSDPVTLYPALRFFLYRFLSLGAMRIFLLLLGIFALMLIAQRLTASLASHVFLLRLLEKYGRANYDEARLPEVLYPPVEENTTLHMQVRLEKPYDDLWKKLTTEEKYVLYDFALDGFTNYKAGILIYKLLHRDLLYVDRNFLLRIRSADFHNYLLSKDIFNPYQENKEDIKVYKYMMSVRKQGFWQAFRVPLQVILGAAGLFIFFTQEALSQKIIGLLTSLPFITQMLASFFERSNGQKNKDPGSDQNPDL